MHDKLLGICRKVDECDENSKHAHYEKQWSQNNRSKCVCFTNNYVYIPQNMFKTIDYQAMHILRLA